jgi:UDP-galactopyranose mutase
MKFMTPPSRRNIDLLCFSHLRWNFVYQRPQHLMSRGAKDRRVYFFEEPVYDAPSQYNEIFEDPESGVTVVTPHITSGSIDHTESLRHLLQIFMASMEIKEHVAWYYTPLSLAFSDHLRSNLVVYDCMDELSSFKFAPPALKEWEKKLFAKADIVFTGGMHLYEAKKGLHQNVHGVPSGIDVDHFINARKFEEDPNDQASIPHPRIGFYGVIDERFNIELLRSIAEQKPEWHFIVIGPTAKIDPATLPKGKNIHFIGMKDYDELPSYLAGWDVAMMPFALNEATKYISPTKTPEFLAAGKPVVSTSVHDVVHPYADKKVVSIADTPAEFIAAIEQYLFTERGKTWMKDVDELLKTMSWDDIWKRMNDLMNRSLNLKTTKHENKSQTYV